ncbi:KCNMB4 [Branchiostoma lanceolatum]|uniref:KCNMB4 protein n=1 Tax=Branchiostoma lanceolatum TaxID=7740 RepID=A0A8J9YP79_BRALA|nr:KCNMB4 [Branchiostoma lanceolatum]
MAACCAVAVIVCGVVITKPIVETNSLEFKDATCTTTQSYLTGEQIGCSCGDKCSSRFPCLRMTVTYVPTNTNNASSVAGVLFDTEQRLNSDGDNAENRQCVTAPCERSESSNLAQVLNFNDTYAPGQSYTCLYHPDNPTKVLKTRLFTWDAMFHSMLWTSIGFAIFTILAIYCLYQCKQARSKVSSIPVTVPPAVPGAQPGYFLTQPPAYSAGGGQPLEMHPPPQDLYSSEKSGYTYN